MQQVDLPEKIIRKYVRFLHQSLPQRPTAINEPYELPISHARDLYSSNYSPEALQRAANHIGFYLGIPISVKVRVLYPDRESMSSSSFRSDDSFSGLYRGDGWNNSEIVVIWKSTYDIHTALAILAHEYAHHYLHHHGVTLRHQMRDEYLTDIATAYLGLGFYVLRGYIPLAWRTEFFETVTRSSYFSIGYLTSDTIAAAILHSTPFRKWNAKDIIRRYPTIAYRLEASIRLLPYRFRRSKQ